MVITYKNSASHIKHYIVTACKKHRWCFKHFNNLKYICRSANRNKAIKTHLNILIVDAIKNTN